MDVKGVCEGVVPRELLPQCLLLPCPSKSPTFQGASIISASVFSPLQWQDEGSLTQMNTDSEIAVYHPPSY